MSFTDVLKKSVTEGFANTDIPTIQVVLTLGITFVIAMYIYFIYRMVSRNALYDKTFHISMAIISVITAGIIVAMQSSIVISLGMVGALSIVRFRTAVKDPLDTAYMFWALTMGILLGANAYVIAVVALLGISCAMLFISFQRLRSPNGYLLVIHHDEQVQREIENELKRSVRFYRIRSKTVTRSGSETTVEVRLDHRADIVSNMLDIAGVHEATLVACQVEAGS